MRKGSKALKPKHIAFMLKFPRATLEDGCWEWTNDRWGNGYGRISWNYSQHMAHRIAYEIFRGDIPDGLHIDHLCGNKACVRPSHLDVVTRQENTRRYFAQKHFCKRGHPFTPENTYTWKGHNGRLCRACRAIHTRKRVRN